jgi:methyl-accepting chemotaxis protein
MNLDRFSVKQVGIASAGLLSLVLTATGGLLQLVLGQVEDGTLEAEAVMATLLAVKDTRFHAVQVQQFLTDVSATGDTGGLEDAQGHLEAGKAALARAVEHRSALADRAQELGAALAKLHAVGVEMAQAYVKEGREAGNKLMQAPGTGFDAAVSTFTKRLGALSACRVAASRWQPP